MNWIFIIISLIFCCVAAFYLNKAQKANLKLSQEINARRMERVIDIETAVRDAAGNIADRSVRKAIEAINVPKSDGYLVTTSSDIPKAYAVWRKVDAMEQNGFMRACYGRAYILVKMFDSNNAEENLKNATELCAKLNHED